MAEDGLDHRARLIVVEDGLARLERSVNTLADTLQRYVQEQAKAPRSIPFKEIISTAAATLAFVVGILAFLDSRAATEAKLATYRIERIERDVEKLAPLKHLLSLPQFRAQ